MARNNRNVRKRGDRLQANWNDETGKREYRTFDTHREAAAFVRAAQARVDEIRHGVRCAPPSKDFDDLVALWERVKGGKRSITDDRSRTRVHLRPVLEGLQMRAITRDVVLRLRERVESTGAAPATVRQVLGLLQAMLRLAHKHGWIPQQPAFDLPKILKKEPNYIHKWSDVLRFLDVAREAPHPGLAEFYATAVYTGLRAGELAMLQWADLRDDWAAITVRRSWNGPPKSGKPRQVPLPPALAAWRHRCPSTTWVFPSLEGNPHAQSARVFNRMFVRCLDGAGLPPMRFHELRHTFASHWVMRGGALYRLQKALGHAAPVMTAHYAHVAPGAMDEDRNLFPVKEPVISIGEARARRARQSDTTIPF